MLINYPFLIKILTGALLNINYNTEGMDPLGRHCVWAAVFVKISFCFSRPSIIKTER